MAKTYYKFAERSAESQINWAEVGRNVSEMLLEDAAQREEKKAAIDESSRQFGEVLANAPTGDFKPANEWVLDYANDATQARLLQDKLLKQGALSLKDYTAQRQNLNDGTNQMFNIAKQYQAKASEVMKRYEAGESQETEAWLMSQIEGLSNFTNTKAYINPTNYQVSIGKMKQVVGADGKTVMMLDNNPNNYMTINELNNYLNIKLDKYDYTAAVSEKVASLGKFMTTEKIEKIKDIYRTYGVTDVSDPTKRPKFGKEVTDEDLKDITTYEKWEEATIKAQLANPFNTLSLLTDVIDVTKFGEEYEPTFDPEQAKDDPLKYILLEKDGSGTIKPKFNAAQENAATSFLRTMIRNSLNQESKTETQALPSIEWGPSSYSGGGGGGGGGGDIKQENINVYEAANNALRTANKSALNTDEYVFSFQNVGGKKIIGVRPKTSIEKSTNKITKNLNFNSKDPAWKALYNAMDVAAYIKGVSNGREKYEDGKENFQKLHGFTLFGSYLPGDESLTPQIYDANIYTQPEYDKRRKSTGSSTASGDALFKK